MNLTVGSDCILPVNMNNNQCIHIKHINVETLKQNFSTITLQYKTNCKIMPEN